MTKVWEEAWDSEERTEAQILHLERHLDIYMAVMNCQPMSGRFPDTTVQILSDAPPTDYFKTGGMFIVSERLKAVLEDFNVNCEFFRLNVINNNQQASETAFYFCNILECVECLDLEHGEFTFFDTPGFTDRVDKIKKLAISEDKVGLHDIFRLAKGGEYIVCASDRLASRIVELHLAGMRFVTQEAWGAC